MTKAFYPGSFDPVTNGHLDLIQRASQLFDEVVVGIMTNPAKQTLFTATERQALMTPHLPDNVSVAIFENQLTTTAAQNIQADVLLRGIRNIHDMQVEQELAQLNLEQAGIETLCLMTNPIFSTVSSSRIKEIHHYGGNINRYVPNNVKQAMDEKGQEHE